MLFNPSITEVRRRYGRNEQNEQSLVMGRVVELHNCRGSWGASEVSRLITLCVVSLAFFFFSLRFLFFLACFLAFLWYQHVGIKNVRKNVSKMR